MSSSSGRDPQILKEKDICMPRCEICSVCVGISAVVTVLNEWKSVHTTFKCIGYNQIETVDLGSEIDTQ